MSSIRSTTGTCSLVKAGEQFCPHVAWCHANELGFYSEDVALRLCVRISYRGAKTGGNRLICLTGQQLHFTIESVRLKYVCRLMDSEPRADALANDCFE